MYRKRVNIFVVVIGIFSAICLLRLTQMQLLDNSFYRERIEQLKLQRGGSRQLRTIRGKILDRKGRILAADQPHFQLCISYPFASLLDERVHRQTDAKQLANSLDDLRQIIRKCAQFKGTEPAEIRAELRKINNFVWNRRAFQAWRTKFPDSEVLDHYSSIVSVPLSKALEDFEEKVPDLFERRRLVNKVDITEMHQSWPLMELETEDDIFTAQLEFDVNGMEISAQSKRYYPYKSVAAQTIGWVGKPQQRDKELFENDRLSSYLDDDVCGREDGIEYVCETILHGRRGEAVYNIDKELVKRTPTQFGDNVRLTLDAELQQRTEQYIADCNLNQNCTAPTAAVVIDVLSGDILVLASMPTFDLNLARYNYGSLLDDANEPLRNRAINEHYPPGSSVKPLILVAGLESGKITPDEVISCPAQPAPRGWPNCWIWNRYRSGHDYSGPNNARHAIMVSCNRFFSILADRIETRVLQQWLFRFGYGRNSLFLPPAIYQSAAERNLRQAAGQISTSPLPANIEVLYFEQIPPLAKGERRYFGIGQGNLRTTPLQVANAIAAIARGGVYKSPRLFVSDVNNSSTGSPELNQQGQDAPESNLNLSPQTLSVLRDGMHAVVNKSGGTAYKAFAHSGLDQQGVTVYGKTGSTEKPDTAWFAGFATGANARSIALSVVVEGGQHGSSDAAPIARDIIQFCIEAGYLAENNNATTAGTPQ